MMKIKRINRVVTFIIAVMTAVSIIPTTVFAEESLESTPNEEIRYEERTEGEEETISLIEETEDNALSKESAVDLSTEESTVDLATEGTVPELSTKESENDTVVEQENQPALEVSDAENTDSKNGFAKDEDGNLAYYKSNVIATDVTDVVKDTKSGRWYNVVKGKVTAGPTVAKNSNGWWYINSNGYVDFTYNGFAKNENGWWYCKKGKVDFSITDVIKGTVDGKTAWWYCKKGKVDFSVTDVIKCTVNGKTAWWYVKENQVTTGPTVAHNINGWWYINSNGYVDFTFTGFAKNENGWWYCKKGKVDFSVTDVMYGTVDGTKKWWNVKKNKVTTGPTVAKNINGWWYVNSKGFVEFTFDGFAKNENGWWYCKGGEVDFSVDNCMMSGTVNGIDALWYVNNNKVIVPAVVKSDNEWVYVDENYNIDRLYTGFAQNANGWWYLEDGVVTFDKNSVIKGTAKGKTAWWNVRNSKVAAGPTVSQNSEGWWYINKSGYVNFSYNGFAGNENGWWLVKDGKVSFNLTGAYWGTVNEVYGRWTVINSKVIIASKGTIIKIPDNLGKIYTLTYYSDKGFVFVPSMRTSIAKGSNQERVWKAWKLLGAKYDNGLATIDGAYLVAVTSTFGKVGDMLEITFRNGDTMLAVIADEKSQQYVAWDHNPANVYGHNNGANVVEFEVDPIYYVKYNHPSSPIIWNNDLKNSGGVAQIENLGHKY